MPTHDAAAPVVYASPEAPAPETREFYQRSLAMLDAAGIPYMVGGGYAMAYYTGIVRCTKDLDVFCRPVDRDRVLDVLAEQGVSDGPDVAALSAKAIHGEASST